MNVNELAAGADDSSIRLLHTALYGDPFGLQREAMRVLRDARVSDPVLRVLIAAASSDDLFVRRRAAIILGHCPSDLGKVLPALLLLIDDPAWSVREAAANGLANCIREHEVELTERFPQVHDAVVSRSIRDSHRLVREAAIRALTEYDEPAPTIEKLLESLQNAKPVVRCRILSVLEHFHSSAELFYEAMIAALDDSDARVRRTAAEIHSRIMFDSRRVLPALTRRQFDREALVSQAATVANALHRNMLPASLQVTLYDLKSEDRPGAILSQLLVRGGTPEAVLESFVALCCRRIDWWRNRRTEFCVNLDGTESAVQLAERLTDAMRDAAAQDRESAWLLGRLVELLVEQPAESYSGSRGKAP